MEDPPVRRAESFELSVEPQEDHHRPSLCVRAAPFALEMVAAFLIFSSAAVLLGGLGTPTASEFESCFLDLYPGCRKRCNHSETICEYVNGTVAECKALREAARPACVPPITPVYWVWLIAVVVAMASIPFWCVVLQAERERRLAA